jgi:hypothetical protein
MQRVERRHMQVKYEQSHCNGEDAVAERLHAACLGHGHRLILIVHVKLYTGLGSATQLYRRVPMQLPRHSSGVLVAQVGEVMQSRVDSPRMNRSQASCCRARVLAAHRSPGWLHASSQRVKTNIGTPHDPQAPERR